MGYLAKIHEVAVDASFFNFKEYMERHDALDTFYFAYKGMDKGEGQLYAIIRTGQSKNPNDFLVLTPDDLINIEKSLCTFMEAQKKSGQHSPFYERLEKVIDKALISMGGHQWSLSRERLHQTAKPAMDAAVA